ncbi:hypothetical protein N7448_005832 [Penicillium atrosanguineum]|uniref:Uncharacterized protein n=1 Tax=Penicillium atrosanguineum TaxID=1132637 RepID=A0A9W9PQI8_9EURO|nr:NADP-dependent alcohol dehydrogenase 7 [Penicillium atrosanguineum]KAJ5131674.1 hypothetical protein N7448_005832 [Penicillium atrosanguineum]KAJ5138121.1 hypothetical protein N7526_004354 [Penicillium atrosanguineum]KAJ5289341.1 NADP-dependent alcohol dehydrogenase 7 [Penicillium atrosanguineum]KAJ5307156.1 hypothetical protein N7476_007812 [Penicillium atrosanguineum]
MDTHLKSPLSPTRSSSATFPLTHGTPGPRPNDPISVEPFSANGHSRRHVRRTTEEHTPDTQDTRRARELGIDETGAKQPKHKHSKSRELRLPRQMSHLASSASARGLLPTWSREKEREGDDGLLRPITRETTRSRWGSESTSRSRKGSLLDAPEQHERLGPIRRQEIQSMDDLELVKKRRKQGEEYLRSALSSIGSQATDVTRRLDYTYYNLLEKITALNSTIASFQDLSDSASKLLSDFERETAGLDQEIRKQINDLKGFEPQIQKVDALEERMKRGRERVEDLGSRLDAVRAQTDSWEQRESEWQSRVSRRLRIFWTVMGSAFLVLVLALVIQNWPALVADGNHPLPTEATNQSSSGASYQTFMWESAIAVDGDSEVSPSRYPSSLEDRLQSLQASSVTVSTTRAGPVAAATEDPFRVLDEL